MSLIKKTTIGIIWNFADQIARRGISILVTLLLARFLTPEDFGLIAMMSVFLALGQTLTDSGLSQALIRQKNVTQADYSTAFYANIVLGLISYSLLFAIAPWVASFYETPALSLLIRVASLTVIISSFQVVQVAHFTRVLDFKLQLRAGLPASLLSGILAIYMAYIEFGVWALIGQMLCSTVLKTIFLWRMQNWRPSRQFDMTALKNMYNFGYKLFISGVLDTIFINIYVVVIAKIFTTSIAGMYFFASKIRELVILQLVRSICSVTYPAFSSLQHDSTRLKAGYRKVIIVVSFIIFPIILFFAVLAEPLFQIILPSKWSPAAHYLQLMCLASVLYPLHAINLNILKVKGRSDLFLYLEILKKIMISLILFLSIKYGIYGILIGQIISSILAYIPNSYFSKKMIGYTVSEQLNDFLPALFLSSLIAAIGYAVSTKLLVGSPFLTLFLVGGTMGGSYLLFAWLFKFTAIQMSEDMLRQKFKRRSK